MLTKVTLPASIYQLMLSHAYSTEKEEIIGMLIGNWKTIPSNNPYLSARTVAQVEYICIFTRSDKRKDRVEISPENLHLAAVQAEEFSKKTGKTQVVVGWYHSHPHITVFPSHVDVQTQLSQQLMDDRFFGIIISCFNSNSDNTEKMQITCFQSETINNAPKKVNVPLEIETEKSIPSEIRQAYITLPQSMYDEHNKEYTTVNQRICYNTNGSDDMSSLPQSITQLYNAGIYGKSISSLMDNLVVPTTHLLDLRSKELDKQIKQLNEYKQYLLSTPRSQRQSPKEQNVNKIEDFLIDL